MVLRKVHKAGEKMFVDWPARPIPVYELHTNLPWQAAIVRGHLWAASSYTWTQMTDRVKTRPPAVSGSRRGVIVFESRELRQ
jgi:hypothetical protein